MAKRNRQFAGQASAEDTALEDVYVDDKTLARDLFVQMILSPEHRSTKPEVIAEKAFTYAAAFECVVANNGKAPAEPEDEPSIVVAENESTEN